MGIDPWGDLAEIQDGAELPGPAVPIGVDDPLYTLSQSPMAVMSAAAVSDTAEWHIDKTGRQYFGYSTRYTGQWDSVEPFTVDFTASDLASSHYSITYHSSDNFKSTIAYEFPEEFYIDVYKDVNYTESDAGYVYLNGVPKFYLQIYNGFGFFSIESKSIHVLVNDSEYVSSIVPGSTVRQEIPVGEVFPEITKVGFRFYFAAGSGQKDTGTSADVVYFQLVPRISNLSVTSSDKATGLLSGILAFLQTIYNAIVSLPSNIASAVSGVLQSLFVPSEDDITAIKSDYGELFSTRLGFIYQAYEWVVNFATTVLNTLQNVASYSFDFPGVAVPLNGTTYQIIPATTVSLDNGVMDVLRPVLGTIVSFVCIVSFVNMAYDMTSALISGTSYFEFMKRGKDDDN